MTKYVVNGAVAVSCWTVVEADSKEEALEIAGERGLAGLCHAPFAGDDDEVFHFSDDGEPFDLQAEEVEE